MHTSYARYKYMEILYYKLAAFITNTKDVWDFCLGGLKCYFLRNPCQSMGLRAVFRNYTSFLNWKRNGLHWKSSCANK
ncbi:hypothetical protein HpHNI68_14390 [Helicobacter pylori]